LPKSAGQCAFRDNIHFYAEQFTQIHKQAALIQKGTAGLKANEQIKIGIFISIAAGDGTKYLDIGCTIAMSNFKDCLTVIDNVFARNCSASVGIGKQGHRRYTYSGARWRTLQCPFNDVILPGLKSWPSSGSI
jgi:hypothetical protein